jgi:hypothetical protein
MSNKGFGNRCFARTVKPLSVWEGYAKALLTGKVPLQFEPIDRFT